MWQSKAGMCELYNLFIKSCNNRDTELFIFMCDLMLYKV